MQSLTLTPFGGMNDQWVAPLGAADFVRNLRVDDAGLWTRSGGLVRLAETAGCGKVTSLGWFSQHDGARQWLVYEATGASSSTYDWTAWNGATLLTLQASRSAVGAVDMPTQYLTAGNWLYAVNGRDAPLRWDGHEVVRVGFDVGPRAPVLEVIDAVDLWPADVNNYASGQNSAHQRGVGPYVTTGSSPWKYVYAFAWLNDLGMQSPLSGRSAITGTNDTDGKLFVRVSLPGAPPQARGWVLYRSENIVDITLVDEQNVHLYAHSAGEFAFQAALLDGTPDNELGSRLDPTPLLGIPPRARLAAVFRNQMYLASSDRLYRSLPLRLEEFPEDHVMRVGNRDSGEITALYATRNALLVFKRRAIYMVREGGDGVVLQTLTETSGCASPSGVVEVPGLGVMFLDEDGPKLLAGSPDEAGELAVVQPMPGVRRLWRRRVNTSALVAAVSVLNWADREAWFQVPADGSDQPSLGFVYHVTTGAWSVREGYPAASMVATRDHRNLVMVGSYGTGDQSGVWVYSQASSTAAGTALSPLWRSAWISLNDPTLTYIPRSLQGYVLANARALTLQHRSNRSPVNQLSTAMSATAKDTETTSPGVWGTALWSTTETWADLGPVPVRWDVQLGAGKVREAQFEIAGDRPALLAVRLDIGELQGRAQRQAVDLFTGGPVG